MYSRRAAGVTMRYRSAYAAGGREIQIPGYITGEINENYSSGKSELFIGYSQRAFPIGRNMQFLHGLMTIYHNNAEILN